MSTILVPEAQTVQSLTKLDFSQAVYLGIDAEWYQPDKSKSSIFLSRQFTFLTEGLQNIHTVVLWESGLPRPSLKIPGVTVFFCDNSKNLWDFVEMPKKASVLMYYSPKDVEALVGRDIWRDALLGRNKDGKGIINKLRNLTGSFEAFGTAITLVDMFGMFNKSLDDALKSVGIDNPFKNVVTELGHSKDRMDPFFLSHPDEALQYAVGDTIHLGELYKLRVSQVNAIIKNALGSEVPAYSVEDFPRSSGSLVSKTFERWLASKYPDLLKSCWLLSDSNDNKEWAMLNTVKGLVRDPFNVPQDPKTLKTVQKYIDAILTGTPESLLKVNKVFNTSKTVHGLGMGGIRNYPLLTQNTGLFGSVVMGGRCFNEDLKENPYDQRLENVVDIDLSSCYGSALKNFDYPFGIPSVFENGASDEPWTLGEFLRSYESRLVKNLYTIYVSGSLSYEQDLVYSKYGLTTKKILRTIISEDFDQSTETDDIWGREVETAHIGGDFLLTKSQIENGIITSDVLETLRKTATDGELRELYNLQVVAAIYYDRREEVSVDDFCDGVLNGTYNLYKGRKGDFRTRKWCRVPLKDFIGKFIAYRKTVKKLVKSKGDENDLLQEAVKLFVNTLYGDLAAPYFALGNTILANNITAKARTGVWMLSKALMTRQSITDGGIFSYKEVAYLKQGKKPGLNALADRGRFKAHRSVKVAPLTDRDVYEWMANRTRDDEAALDAMCTEHINDFWGKYDLVLPFDIEVKYSHTAKRAVYLNSADYLLADIVSKDPKEWTKDPVTGQKVPVLVKVRGAKQDAHPKKLLLWHILEPETYEVPDPEFHYEQLVGVKDFQKKPHDDLMPGDAEVASTVHKPHPAPHFKTLADRDRFLATKKKTIQRFEKLWKAGTQEHYGVAKKMKDGTLRRPTKTH